MSSPIRAVSREQMQALDRKAIEEYGIPSLILMENAGRGIAEYIFQLTRKARVTVLVGKGNNGGDGFVIARHLSNHGYECMLLLLVDPAELKSDPKVNYDICINMGIPCEVLSAEASLEDYQKYLDRTDITVDALFGVGLTRAVEGAYALAIEAVNRFSKMVLAVDIPSGLDANTGAVLGCSIKAAHTGTLGLPKKGLLEAEGPEHAGRVFVVDIGLPRAEITSENAPLDTL